MDNIYILPTNSILDIFESIDVFLNKVEKFKEYQPDYKYELEIQKSNKQDYKWELKAKVWHEESKKIKTSEKLTNPFGVL